MQAGSGSLELTPERQALFDAHVPLALGLARRFSSARAARYVRDELRQAALIGLAKAARDYDPNAEGKTDGPVPFGAWATAKVRWQLCAALVPARDEHGGRSGSRHTGFLEPTSLRDMRRHEVSASEPSSTHGGDDGEFTKGDLAEAMLGERETNSGPAADARSRALWELRRAISALEPRERRALELRVMEGLTRPEAAARMGIGEKAVAWHVQCAVTKLRVAFLALGLPALGPDEPLPRGDAARRGNPKANRRPRTPS